MNGHYLGLGHVAVYTRNIEESVAFYEKLGGTVKGRGCVSVPEGEKKLALVLFGGITLELIHSPGDMPMGEGNVPHFALLVDDLDAGEEGSAGPFRGLAELVFYRPFGRAD